MSLAAALLPEFDREMGVTRRLLERLPDAQFTWQPHARSMTLGRLAEHLAELPQWLEAALMRESVDMATPRPPDHRPPASRAEVLARFDRNVIDARAILSARSDAEMHAPWTLLSGGKPLFTMPRTAVVRFFVLNHVVHHRGQLTVYLRMHDVPLPSIYGPSADEAL